MWSTWTNVRMIVLFAFAKSWRCWVVLIPTGLVALGYWWGSS